MTMTNELEFQEFPKMARLSREIIVTEKIDGTNAQLLITEDNEILVGSRNRWITPSDDNFGFAKWVEENKQELLKLGKGRHFGEWWGNGIQRGYNLIKGDRRLSLFNTSRWALFGTEPKMIPMADPRIVKYQDLLPSCVGLVPILYKGIFDTGIVDGVLEDLKINGSLASPSFFNPEGIVMFHIAGNVGFKKTIKNDNLPKSKQ